MPARSKGCLTCRRRKIRCDETRPGCRRCATHGVTCLGYRTQQPGGFEFEDQSAVTVQRAAEQYRKEPSSPRKPVSPDAQQIAIRQSNVVIASTDVSRRMPTQLAELASAEINRSQFMSTFLDLHLPRASPVKGDHLLYLKTIVQLPSQQTVLSESLDTIALVQIGSVHHDARLLNEARRAYGKALASLARRITSPNHVCSDELLAASTILLACEFFREIAHSGMGWRSHLTGVQSMLAARGPASLQSSLAFALFQNARQNALCHGIIRRKASFYADQDWLRASKEGPARDAATALLDLGIRLPGLLERNDRMKHANFSLPEIDHLLGDCSALDAQLHAWYAAFEADAPEPVRELVPIDCFPTFTALCPDRHFTTAYWFPSFVVMYLQGLYWCCLHELRRNMQALQRRRAVLAPTAVTAPGAAVREPELLAYAEELCRCIPYCTEPVSGSTGAVGIFLPIRTAMLHFEKQRNVEQLAWCRAVRDSVFVNGLCPPNMGRAVVLHPPPELVA